MIVFSQKVQNFELLNIYLNIRLLDKRITTYRKKMVQNFEQNTDFIFCRGGWGGVGRYKSKLLDINML